MVFRLAPRPASAAIAVMNAMWLELQEDEKIIGDREACRKNAKG
ncbi:MAG: hypothetical protein R3D85_05285 [Paracoccaceae bacterium]